MSYSVALMISLIGGAFIFAYISTLIGTNEDKKERPVIHLFYTAFKLLLLAGSFMLVIVAINANQGIWRADGVNPNQTIGTSPSNLGIAHQEGFRIAVWIPVIFFGLMGFLVMADFLYLNAMRRKL